MFTVGNIVTYGAIGVCEITDITKNKLTGVLREYYVLCPVDTDKSVIYVPVDNEQLVSRMRYIPDAQEFMESLRSIDGEKIKWIDENLARAEQFRHILNDGELLEVVKLFRALHHRALELEHIDKHLPKADERLYKEASKLLCAQLSYILSVDSNEVLSMLI